MDLRRLGLGEFGQGREGGVVTPNHLLLRPGQSANAPLHAARTAAPALSCSALGTRHPLCEAAVGLQHVVGAAVPGEPVPVPGERQRVQLPAVQSLQQQQQQQQHALLQPDQVRWVEISGRCGVEVKPKSETCQLKWRVRLPPEIIYSFIVIK